MAHETTSDFLLDRLEAWGVHRIFGYPGDGINGIMGALGRAQAGRFDYVQVRHEEAAALMASASAKFTGEVGVCLATSGPGAIHLLNGLYDARKDMQPVVAIVGQQPTTALGGDAHQEVDLQVLLSAATPEYCITVTEPAQMRHAIDRAFRIAKARRAPTSVIIANDVQEMPAVPMPPHAHGMLHTSAAYSEPLVVPRSADIAAAAALLNAGDKVALLIGSGARGARQQVLAVADRLQAGVAKALLGKDVLADDLPFVTGTIGLLGTKPSWDMMRECDTLLLVGTNFPYGEFLPEPGQARSVQVELDGSRAGLRHPTDINLVGDAAATLDALLPLLDVKPTGSKWRARIESSVAEWWNEVEREAKVEAEPVNPALVAHELSQQLPDGAIVTADSGTSVYWFAHTLRMREGMRGSLSGQLASMGVGVPYAIAAKFAHPDRPVIGLVGDGSMQMDGMAELLTIAKYHEQWSDPRLVICVFDNSDLNFVTWEQRVMAGDPRFDAAQSLPPVDYAAVARAIGLGGERVENPHDVAGAWQRALSADRPVVLDFVVDPDVAPLPPHIDLAQAKHMLFSMARGDSRREGVVIETVRQLVGRHHD